MDNFSISLLEEELKPFKESKRPWRNSTCRGKGIPKRVSVKQAREQGTKSRNFDQKILATTFLHYPTLASLKKSSSGLKTSKADIKPSKYRGKEKKTVRDSKNAFFGKILRGVWD